LNFAEREAFLQIHGNLFEQVKKTMDLPYLSLATVSACLFRVKNYKVFASDLIANSPNSLFLKYRKIRFYNRSNETFCFYSGLLRASQ
jgi:hypothetical protein